MKQRAILSSDSELGFNPGMDLMISLFAMSLLIMLVGIFFYNGVIAFVNEDVEDKIKEILLLQQQIEQLEQEIEKLLNTDKSKKQLLSENLRLQRQLKLLKEQLAILRKKYDSIKETLDNFQKSNPEYTGLSLNKLLKLLQQEIEKLKIEIESTKPILVFELRETDAAFFKIGKSILTEAAHSQLAQEAPQILRELAKKSANQVNILGYASPEKKPFKKFPEADGNLDLSVDRAVAVAHYLKSLGISYECMSISGFGRGRSQLLYEWKQKGPNRTMEEWDNDKSIRSNRKYNRESRKERKVVLQVVYDRESKCTM